MNTEQKQHVATSERESSTLWAHENLPPVDSTKSKSLSNLIFSEIALYQQNIT